MNAEPRFCRELLGSRPVSTPMACNPKAQGRAAHPGLRDRVSSTHREAVPQSVAPLRGAISRCACQPRVRYATLGFGVKPLRGWVVAEGRP